MKRWIRDHGLSLTMFGLFVGCIVGQAFAGWRVQVEDEKEHGAQPPAFSRYLTSGDFIEAVFENWESEFLQMGAFVFLSAFLVQRGSSQSKKPHERAKTDQDLDRGPSAPWAVRHGGWALKLYNSSLSLAMLGLFLFSFALHAVGGTEKHNREAQQHGQPSETLLQYVGSSSFWFESLQNWQSEFLSMGMLIVLSVYLRQRGSPESKEVDAPHAKTGAS